VRSPHSLLRGKNGKPLINFCKAENDDIDALKLGTKNYLQILPECPAITAIVTAFDAKAFNDTELLQLSMAGGNRIFNFHRQTNRKRLGYIFGKIHGL